MPRLRCGLHLLCLLLLLGAGAASGTPSPDKQVQLDALRVEAARLSLEIEKATTEDARYSGGLVKSLIGVRLEILRTTKELVNQRIQTIEAGSPVTLVTLVATPDPAKAASLAEEIAKAEAALADARLEADRYSGGLVAVLKLSTVATQEQTLAMLRQQYLFTKYGLTYPESHRSTPETSDTALPSASASATPNPLRTSADTQPSSVEIVEISTRITETNSTWWKYAWKLTLRSTAAQALQLDAHIEFLDQDGFVVDDAREYNLSLRPGEEGTFTGYELIDADVAANVQKVSAKVTQR